jgi:ubiquinone/menaquinone biosynthesis C-methylase UbiE
MIYLWILLGIIAAFVAISLGWRWASRVWSLPCPTLFAGGLESSFAERINGKKVTLERLGLRPGQKILEIGPGPGRLLVPAAQSVLPGGEAVGVELQQGMIDRLKARAEKAGVTNLSVIHGDATQAHVSEGSFDLVFLATVLGEIPDRAAALAQCYRALKPGGVLSVTEMFGDPHYQSRSRVRQLAEAAGFRARNVHGNWLRFTADFVKP